MLRRYVLGNLGTCARAFNFYYAQKSCVRAPARTVMLDHKRCPVILNKRRSLALNLEACPEQRVHAHFRACAPSEAANQNLANRLMTPTAQGC